MMKKCSAVILGLLSATALSISGVYVEEDTFQGTLREEIDGIGFEYFILLIGLCWFYYYMTRQRYTKHWTIHVLSALFSGFMLVGLSFTQNGSLDFVLASRAQLAVAIIVFAGYFILFEAILQMIYHLLDVGIMNPDTDAALTRNEGAWDAKVQNEGTQDKEKAAAGIRAFVEKHFFTCAFIIIVVFWLPWLLAFFPGSISSDAGSQLMQAYGYRDLTDQHSWVLSLLMGCIMRIGQRVSDNFGLLLIAVIFYLFEALCYAWSCKIVSKWTLPFCAKIALVLFFAIFPIFGAYAQAVLKDSPFMAAFVLYMAVYIDTCIRFEGSCKKKTGKKICLRGGSKCVINRNEYKSFFGNLSMLLIIGMLVCVFRNNGFYLVLPATLFLIVMIRTGLRRFGVALLIATYSLFWLYGNILAPAVGVRSISASTRGILYMPFQITGRYMSEHPDDLTDSEREVLSSVFNDYELLGELYTPEKADAVKSKYKGDYTDEAVNSYLKVVFSMVKKHPKVCLEAVLNQSYGYYYPFYNCDVMGSYCFYIVGNSTKVLEKFDLYYMGSSSFRTAMSKYAGLWKTIPGLSQFMNPAMPTWILFILAGYLAYRKKWKVILTLAAPAANMAICIISPVNGYLRYAMPSLACMPILFIACMLMIKDNQQENGLAEDKEQK